MNNEVKKLQKYIMENLDPDIFTLTTTHLQSKTLIPNDPHTKL